MLAALVAVPSRRAFALDRDRAIGQFVHDSWGARDGLPEGAVLALHQSPDGYLWLGTQFGLLRFDGVRFTRFAAGTPGLKQHSFGRALMQGPGGEIWAGLAGGVARYDGDKFTFFDSDQGLTHPFVYALAQAPQGAVWVGTGGAGVWRLWHDRFTKHSAYLRDPSLPANINDLAVDHQGTLWAATDGGVVALSGESTVQRFVHKEDGLPSPVANVLRVDQQGTLWIGTQHGLVRAARDAPGKFTPVDAFAGDDITALFQDRDGSMWVGTRDGVLGRIGLRGVERAGGGNMAPRAAVMAFSEDDTGSLWVGTADGLERYHDGTFVTTGRADGLPNEQLLNLAARPDGGLWILDGAGRLLVYEKRTVREVAPAGTIAGQGMLGLLGTADGSLWVGGATLRRFHAGQWTRYAQAGGEFTVLAPDGAGLLVAQTASDGTSLLSRFENGTFAPIPVSVQLTHVQRIHRDRRGDLWISTGGGGLVHLSAHGIRRFTVQDGLPHNVVYGIEEDEAGSLWVATRGGLARIRDERVANLAGTDYLPRRSPIHVNLDGFGHLWVTADDGIYRIKRADLDAAADGFAKTVSVRRFTPSDGLASIQVSWRCSAVVRTLDGRLWYATERGLSSVNPRSALETPPLPPVRIEEVVFGGRRAELSTAPPVGLGHERIEIRYTAASPTKAAGLRFRYRLLGNDADWIDAQIGRVAYYTNVSPGSYIFEVAASWGQGSWSDRAATVKVYIEPRWYQTLLARIAFAGLVAAVLLALSRLGLRQMRKRERALVRRVSERTQALHHEIAERRSAEEQVRLLNQELESRVHERTAELEVANLALAEDVAERQRAEAALAEEKERLAVTLSSIAEGVITTDGSGKILLMNPVAERDTGWPLADVKGLPSFSVFQVLDRTTRAPLHDPVAEVLAAPNAGPSTLNRALLSCRSGGEILVDASAAPIKDHDQSVIGAVLAFRDVTEKTRHEEQMQKDQKLEAVGVLAGGIAHDFNNLLTGLFGNISLARTALPSESPASSWLDAAATMLEHARSLTRQLLTFSAEGHLDTEPHSLDEILRRSVRLVPAWTRITTELAIPVGLWPCDIDPTQIGQAIDNIVLHARQAMPDGGSLRISAANVELAEGTASRLPAGRYVEIAISDTGPGIPLDIQDKVFDPYFTTKQTGSGLGLASVFSILTQHGGTIDLESNPPHGTTFRIRLRATDAVPHPTHAPGPLVERADGTGNRERVLAMDDQTEVLKFLRTALERQDYTVSLARDSREALALFSQARAEGTPFQLVILDLTIEGGPGAIETLAELRAIDPCIRAIASSGYSNNDVMSNPERFGFTGVLAKPYTIAELYAAVESALQVDLS